ncbi:MAG: hypothetical protein ACYSWU_01000 [Planctomycetota bacterium]
MIMVKLALAVLLTIVIVVFSISNSHHVDLSLALGDPIQIRLVFLLLSAFIVGMAVPIFYRLIRRLDHDRLVKRENELQQTIERFDQDIAA